MNTMSAIQGCKAAAMYAHETVISNSCGSEPKSTIDKISCSQAPLSAYSASSALGVPIFFSGVHPWEFDVYGLKIFPFPGCQIR